MDFVAVERFGRPNCFGRENFGRGRSFVSRIDRHGRSVPIRNFRADPLPIAAALFGRARERFCHAIDESGRARAIPSRLDRNGRPDENCSAKILLRVRGQCFGADCVFTPFSPSILS
ncbi:unnamed protein product [Microthlaspi erraticum]|uniref:Uncharacterized protein n=1 Tax=Microthlaspi erraticum TaxID=1685480 RepID=A0A6D2IV01_9BRAS|nr:unnamed protein product [Microthlaspi erraticum]